MYHNFIFLKYISLLCQMKELESENEEIRLRNLRRVRTEEKLFGENCVENGEESSEGGKVRDETLTEQHF